MSGVYIMLWHRGVQKHKVQGNGEEKVEHFLLPEV